MGAIDKVEAQHEEKHEIRFWALLDMHAKHSESRFSALFLTP